jgi:hypothetical protein
MGKERPALAVLTMDKLTAIGGEAPTTVVQMCLWMLDEEDKKTAA